ncbi:phytanoyl-CoA dioxygenase [Meridianimarinicoccus roseus]|uniref:Phytanoyl-CoA dioxygenase n=1 Tax=Meridianimarinicoccus roseus TaxID=2072018 RepID=A0A2V2LI39_9RHOB|nr:phytanoyl-CoA dioxygenase family protein [Meridianimarinicoccus roseus]PWR04592.1 phytanoyl-CoA dioxygenase [Meridianimarinicoccus roseus]
MKDTAYFEDADNDLAAFLRLIDRTTGPTDAPRADEIAQNVPVYDMVRHVSSLAKPDARRALMGEWANVLGQGAGVLVLRGAYADTAPIDAATRAFEAIIADEKGRGGADHFAASGANDRVWNALQKLCMNDPATFALYFGNPVIAAVCEAWLGPGYQMTAQVNLVRPGGKPQLPHRDYHLGFQTADMALRFPAHVHDLSAAMTLQGAVAHCDMPVESGPTRLLPFSQLFRPGYLAYRLSAFAALFEERCVQLPLSKGDAVFFNPALFHGAGANDSADIDRMANLLQVSSPFGRAMEVVDRGAMCRALYPALKDLRDAGRMGPGQVAAAIAACAEGYSFPTNLDTDPPEGGLAPETQAALFARALQAGLDAASLDGELSAHEARRRP